MDRVAIGFLIIRIAIAIFIICFFFGTGILKGDQVRKFGTYILRSIVSPAIWFILFITHLLFVFNRTWKFIKFGGEFNLYKDGNETKTISDIYDTLKTEKILSRIDESDLRKINKALSLAWSDAAEAYRQKYIDAIQLVSEKLKEIHDREIIHYKNSQKGNYGR